MVSMHESVGNALRFLCCLDFTKAELKLNEHRFCDAVLGFKWSTCLLHETLKSVPRVTPRMSSIIVQKLNSLYATDVNSGEHTIEETVNLIRKLREVW